MSSPANSVSSSPYSDLEGGNGDNNQDKTQSKVDKLVIYLKLLFSPLTLALIVLIFARRLIFI